MSWNNQVETGYELLIESNFLTSVYVLLCAFIIFCKSHFFSVISVGFLSSQNKWLQFTQDTHWLPNALCMSILHWPWVWQLFSLERDHMRICICIVRAWLQESCSLLCHFKLLILYIATNHQTLLLLFYFQHPAGVFVHPSGVEQSLHDCINAMRSCYGDKQGRKFQVWVDRVSPVQMSSDTWIVKFDKWELSGKAYTTR